MRRGWAVAVMMCMAMMGMVAVGIGWNHHWMLYYNITSAKAFKALRLRNRAIAVAAARNGKGTDAARNQTNLVKPMRGQAGPIDDRVSGQTADSVSFGFVIPGRAQREPGMTT
jgi:hypothetical protein